MRGWFLTGGVKVFTHSLQICGRATHHRQQGATSTISTLAGLPCRTSKLILQSIYQLSLTCSTSLSSCQLPQMRGSPADCAFLKCVCIITLTPDRKALSLFPSPLQARG